MRSEDHGAARAYPLPNDYELEPDAPPLLTNAFTPISATERFAQKHERPARPRHTSVMPPLTPGQSYLAPAEDRPLFWEDAFEESNCENRNQPPYPPPQSGYGYPEEADIFRAEGGADNDAAYAYEGWHQAGQGMDAPYTNAYPNAYESYPAEYGAAAPYPYTGYETEPMAAAWQESAPWPQWQPEAYPAEGMNPAEPSPAPWQESAAWPQWESEAYPKESAYANGSGYSSCAYDPRDAAEPVSPAKPAPRVRKEKAAPSPATRMSLAKIAAICAITLMLVFCLVEVGKIVLSLLRNEAEMKTVREDYLAQAGVDLSRNASAVELLPPGVTFTPTATPALPQGTEQADIPEAALAAASEGAQAEAAPQDQRSKAASYADNPLCNVLPEFEELQKENADIRGRLSIEGLLDQTVVQRNNTYYLTHNAGGGFSGAGAVFIDESCSLKTPPENLLLRAQSGETGAPFAALAGFEQGGVSFVRQHGLIRMDTLYEREQYVVFAVIRAANDSQAAGYFNYAGYPAFHNDWQFDSHVAAARQASLYDIPVDVQASDRLLTLSTLGDGAAEDCLVILARKLRPGESAQSLSTAMSGIKAK